MSSDDWPEWLPSGWSIQIKKSHGLKIKSYIDPQGHKFYSKPQVFRHLKAIQNSIVSEKRHNDHHGTPENLASEPDLFEGNESSYSLPDGWVMELKVRSNGTRYKCYTDPESGRKFYSKPQVFRYLKSVNRGKTSEKKQNDDHQEKVASEPRLFEKYQRYGWLPNGWVAELKVKSNGLRYKCYVDPERGRKFYSKPAVLRYLKTVKSGKANEKTESDAIDVKNNKSGRKRAKIRKYTSYKVISRGQADGLPPGWIKEVRFRGPINKDPYFTDPVSGYIFRSKLDALRYLNTGDINKCAIKPIKNDINEEDSSIGADDEKKQANTTTRRQLFEEEEANKNESINNIDAQVPKTEILEENQTLVKCTETKVPENNISPRKNKSKKKSPATLPGRSSKRLKGLEPEIKVDLLSKKRVTRTTLCGLTTQSELQSEPESNEHLKGCEAAQEKQLESINVESQTIESQTKGCESAQEKQPESVNVESQTSDEKTKYQLSYSPVDSNWTHSCVNFEVKTPTGQMPVNGEMGQQGSVVGENKSKANVN